MPSKSPIDTANPRQLIWKEVAPVFEACRHVANPTYVYFIGEKDDGFLKIGLAKNPFKRVSDMQVGNPRRLRIERLLMGDKFVESLMHELWFEYRLFADKKHKSARGRPRTEWFRPDIRQKLFPIVDDAREKQIALMASAEEGAIDLADLERIVRQAHVDADHEAKMIAPVYQLSTYGVVPSRPSPI
jgi:hypothetical protein